MDVLRLLEHFGINVVKTHEVHCALISQVGAILVVAHADGGTGGVLVLTDEEAGIYALCFQAAFHQIAETVVTDHSAESHFGTYGCRIGGEDSGRTAEGEGHLLGKLLLTHFGKALNVIEYQINVELA